ncbi:MAG: 2-oxo acid dehydrogenase subunit E2 [Deltaproteobacteria bacterium]|nr:2-oxo acid dehydrogenase subunit E2 [Deltaproteobacteria bacterium]
MRHVFRLPDVGEGITEAEVVEYLVQVGDRVKADQPVIRVETDKAVVELPAPVTGTVTETPHSPGDTVKVGDPLLVIETEEKAVKAPPEKKEKPKEAPKAPPPEKEPLKPPKVAAKEEEGPVEPAKKILATPHTRRLARELGVDITAVKGSGPRGRITDEDLRETAKKKEAPPPKGPTAAAVQAPATAGFDFEKYGPTKRVPLKGIRKRTAEVMVRSVSTIPHVTHFDEADVTELQKVRDREKTLADQRGVKLTILAFLTKAVADALKKYPMFNASLDEATGEIVYKQYYNVGFATDTEAGLMVPVVRDVDKKSILQIAAELNELSRKARDRTIELEDMRGGTFTITNVGALGGAWATPIIVHPEVAILCSLRAMEKAVVRNGEVVVRTIMPLTLSFDHRVLDGADAARFMSHVVALLEDPLRMLVDVA